MKTVVDENIPFGREAFSQLGEVVTAPGRSMTADTVRDADLLMVRSVTKVNAGLLDGSRVRFVGTATIGEDHVDRGYLSQQGIGFSSAPGCNANSVAEYIVAAILELAGEFGFDLAATSLGVVGVGNVGSKVAQKASALGMRTVLNDPPLARTTGDPRFQPMDAIVECDIVTFHVPLTKEGQDATRHLLDEALIERLGPETIVLNTARGAVADNSALLRALEAGKLRSCVLDVWEGEPSVNPELLERTFIGTPHIAGYSFDGKVNGTLQIYEAACRFLQIEPDWNPGPLLPAPECAEVAVDPRGADLAAILRPAVRAVYDIREDDESMRGLLELPEAHLAVYFDQLRKEYPRRREFFNTRARVVPPDEKLTAIMSGLGFRCG